MAYYEEGTQIWEAPQGMELEKLLVPDLETIRKQQQASEDWRTAQGITPQGGELGYKRIKV